MMKNVLVSIGLIISSTACSVQDKTQSNIQGWDSPSALTCKNDKYSLELTKKGSFSGTDRIVLRNYVRFPDKMTNNFFILNEKHSQSREPSGMSAAEKLAIKELPCSTKSLTVVLKSKKSIIVQAFPDFACEKKGERTTHYVQLNDSPEVIKFTDCVSL